MTMANYSHLSKEAFPSSVAVCQKIVEQLTQVDYVRLIVKVTAQWYTICFLLWNFFDRDIALLSRSYKSKSCSWGGDFLKYL